MFIGDPRVMPMPGWRFDEDGLSGVSFAIVEDGPLTTAEHWAGTMSSTERDVREVLQLISINATARGGRLLAPYAVRYVIIPKIDGVNSTIEAELAVPRGLVESLEAQLDFRPVLGPPHFLVFENVAWLPTRSTLGPAAAQASTQAGAQALARTSLDAATPVFVGARDRGPAFGALSPGVLHIASVIDDRWSLTIDGTVLEPRSAFGGTTAFEVPNAGVGAMVYRTSGSRHTAVVAQIIAWLLFLFAASRIDFSGLRRRRALLSAASGDTWSLDDAGSDPVDELVDESLDSSDAVASDAVAGDAVASDEVVGDVVGAQTAEPQQ